MLFWGWSIPQFERESVFDSEIFDVTDVQGLKRADYFYLDILEALILAPLGQTRPGVDVSGSTVITE